jgi:hypothetical protein
MEQIDFSQSNSCGNPPLPENRLGAPEATPTKYRYTAFTITLSIHILPYYQERVGCFWKKPCLAPMQSISAGSRRRILRFLRSA